MSEPTAFQPQKTDQLSGTTNPYQAVVLLKGSTTITMSSQTTGFAASVTVSLPIDTSNFFLQPIGFTPNWQLGGGVVESFPIPFCSINTSGNVARSGSIYIQTDLKPLSYILNIELFDRTTQQNAITVYYKVLALGF